jgi:hypothetical protein
VAARYDDPVIANGRSAREQGTCRVTDFTKIYYRLDNPFLIGELRRMLSPKDTIASRDPLTRNPQLLDRYGYQLFQ